MQSVRLWCWMTHETPTSIDNFLRGLCSTVQRRGDGAPSALCYRSVDCPPILSARRRLPYRASVYHVPIYYCTAAIPRNIGFGFITVANGTCWYKVNVRNRHTHLATTRNYSPYWTSGWKDSSLLPLYWRLKGCVWLTVSNWGCLICFSEVRTYWIGDCDFTYFVSVLFYLTTALMVHVEPSVNDVCVCAIRWHLPFICVLCTMVHLDLHHI